MGWLLLAVAILLEVSGTTSMKVAEGFTRPLPSILVFVCYAGSLTALTFALRYLELGAAYAVWAGVGTALVAVIGYTWFEEEMTPLKLGALVLIVVGVIALRLGGAGEQA